MWILAAIIVLLVLLGVVFSMGRGAFLIAGYNTASKAEKAKYDEKALCRFMGKLMFALAGCQCAMGLGLFWTKMWLYWAGLAAFLAVILGGVIYANTGNRFQKKSK